jgi:hypothetical protein
LVQPSQYFGNSELWKQDSGALALLEGFSALRELMRKTIGTPVSFDWVAERHQRKLAAQRKEAEAQEEQQRAAEAAADRALIQQQKDGSPA